MKRPPRFTYRFNYYWLYFLTAGFLGMAAPVYGRDMPLDRGDRSLGGASQVDPNRTKGGSGISFDLQDPWLGDRENATPVDHQSLQEQRSQPSTEIQNKDAIASAAPLQPRSMADEQPHFPDELEQEALPTSSAPINRLPIPSGGLTPPSSLSDASSVLKELPPPPSRPSHEIELDVLFQGGEHSLVAIAIGHLEGTRLPNGRKTLAYYGKRDPRTQQWTVGTFARPGKTDNVEESETQYLGQLYRHATVLQRQAAEQEVQWNREIQLNAIDVVHQNADAGLAADGFVGRLQQAQSMGIEGSQAILWARTRSLLNADSRQWNDREESQSVQAITDEQERRQRAIAQVLDTRRADPHSAPDPLTARQSEPDLGAEDAWLGELISLDLSAT